MRKYIMLTVEWGHMSETYDFADRLVVVEEDQIIRIYPWVIGDIVYGIRRLFRLPIEVRYYGYGYEHRNRMFDDLASRRLHKGS